MESPVQCGCNAHAAPGFFSLAGTAVEASGTDAQPDVTGSVLRGLGSFPNKQGCRVTKALLAEEFDSLTKRLIDAKIMQ